MSDWFKLPEKTRIEIFNQVGVQNGLPATAIEKDWWVSLALRVVFSLPFSNHIVFKGGTSLSKGWNLIDRFSEDIDLAIDRGYLGFSEKISKSGVKRLRKASCKFVSHEFLNSIESRLKELEIPIKNLAIREFNDSDTDPLIIELYYKSITEKSDYLLPRILFEVGARSLIEPYEKRPIQSMVGMRYKDQKFADPASSIPTVLPERTFLEKVFLLHEEFQKNPKKIRVARLSRHLYDLEKLMSTEHGLNAIFDKKLYDAIVTHRSLFNPIKGVDYKNHSPSKIDFIPPKEIIGAWEKDYSTMRESMIYGETLSFEKLIERLKELRVQFRSIKV
ncbi:nucleotidyl transferase AbiEii/AbiGii toxin family protein [Fulvivirgaceae bacterium BMA12]|uniref:Nucleotidyl transferase AbiEii/AbiGii toxin family protein n=1 Tax=Agaribacillus aureus TaxID=3051825 RepID=A0ABT8LC46_9BACT|nr:nucleotidyl transferase AbiEii/AbiGii toxin family protein [Fulvivirgaceae bacterium BMA12]